MTQPFNSPRQALSWLKRRNLIASIEGTTIVRHDKPVRWYASNEKQPPEDRLDDEAEMTIKAYGYTVKRPKRDRAFGVIPQTVVDAYGGSGFILNNPVMGNSVTSVSIDTETSAPEPLRGFAGSPIVEEPEWVIPSMEEVYGIAEGPGAFPPVSPPVAPPTTLDRLNAIFSDPARGRVLDSGPD